jgi:hypothetical protein
MLSIVDVKSYLNSISEQVVEPLGFKTNSPIRSTSFRVGGGRSITKTISSVDLTITCRSSHPSEAELDIYEWYYDLNQKTNFKIKNNEVILVRVLSVPNFLGQYENGLFYFSVIFSLLMEVQQ